MSAAQAPSGFSLSLPPQWSEEALAELDGLFARVAAGQEKLRHVAGLLGGPVEQAGRLGRQGLKRLPGLERRLRQLGSRILQEAFRIATIGLPSRMQGDWPRRAYADYLPRAAVLTSGIFGGMGGLAALGPDLTVSSLVVLREIAKIALENGEDLSDPQTLQACLEVFALSGKAAKNAQDAGSDGGMPGFLLSRSLIRGQSLVYLLNEITAHYGIRLSGSIGSRLLPVAGALCGAAMNAVFLEHYAAVARLHFALRKYERLYGRR